MVALEVACQHVQPQPQSATGDGLHPEAVLTAVHDVVVFEAHRPACAQPVRQGYLQSAAVSSAGRHVIRNPCNTMRWALYYSGRSCMQRRTGGIAPVVLRMTV